MKPINRLPLSPRKIVAGLKLKRRNPRIAPARTTVSREIKGSPLTSDIIKTVTVEKSADPAASPSSPSIRLKALVINNTQIIVSGSAAHSNSSYPKSSGNRRTRNPPIKSSTAARLCTASFT